MDRIWTIKAWFAIIGGLDQKVNSPIRSDPIGASDQPAVQYAHKLLERGSLVSLAPYLSLPAPACLQRAYLLPLPSLLSLSHSHRRGEWEMHPTQTHTQVNVFCWYCIKQPTSQYLLLKLTSTSLQNHKDNFIFLSWMAAGLLWQIVYVVQSCSWKSKF